MMILACNAYGLRTRLRTVDLRLFPEHCKHPTLRWLCSIQTRRPLGKPNLVEGIYCLHEESGLAMDTETKSIATKRIHTLFRLARSTIHEDSILAQRYVDTARRIAMAAKVRLPTEYRRQVCRHCKSFILPGVNCRVRIKQRREPHVVITCINCGKQMRIPLKIVEEELRP